MHVRRIRLCLWAVVVSTLLTAAAVSIGLLTAPLSVPGVAVTQAALAATQPAADAEGSQSLPSLASLEPLWLLDLRRPLYDPAPAAVVQAPKAPLVPLAVKLSGTVIEPGHSKALLSTSQGKTQLKAVGEKIEDVEILAIEPDAVTVLHDGSRVVLKLSKNQDKP